MLFRSAIYSSPDGLVLASNSGINLVTEQIFTRDQWQDYYPSQVEGYEYEGKYLGFTWDGSDSNTKKGFIFDPRGGKNAFVNLDFYAHAGYNDREEDELYLVIGGTLKKFARSASKRKRRKALRDMSGLPLQPRKQLLTGILSALSPQRQILFLQTLGIRQGIRSGLCCMIEARVAGKRKRR